MQTRLTQLLGIKYPILQSAMSFVSYGDLVVAVCNAGGLGILATGHLTPDTLRQEIRAIRSRVGNKPFGANITPLRPGYRKYLQVVLEEKVPVWSSGLRDPFRQAGIQRPPNVIYIPTVGTVAQAKRVEKDGADAVVVQGWEAGGHASSITTMVIIPETVEAVKIPVIAAGGICDGKGMAAALVLGAEGVAMGTRFATSRESPIPAPIKQKYLEASDADAIRSTLWDGVAMRAIRGQKMKHYHGWWTEPWNLLPRFIAVQRRYNATFRDMITTSRFLRSINASMPQFLIGLERFRRGMAKADLRDSFSPAGQVVGRIRDIPSCQEILERTVAEAEHVLRDTCDRATHSRHQ